MEISPSLQVSRSIRTSRLTMIFWVLALVAIPIWAHYSEPVIGWDLQVYRNAIHAMSQGHDPYADGIAVQRVFHATFSEHPSAIPPYTYVYSPLTLPLLRWIGGLPTLLTGLVYWLLFAAATLVAIFTGFWCAEPREQPYFLLLTPLAIFFPGLLLFDVIFSGNIAYTLYGIIFITALIGWRSGRWKWFYIAVLAASCCKAPMLSLLAIPVLSARKQWTPTLLTGAAGVLIFAMQPHIWHTLFQHYLEAVELQFSFNQDFGISPAGVLALKLYNYVPYKITSSVFYAIYAAVFAAILFTLSRKFLAGRFSLKQWIPVMMLGVILLNPRVMEYDIAPITLMMALVLWRVSARTGSLRWAIVFTAGIAVAANIGGKIEWRTTECCVLVFLFLCGSADLYLKARDAELSRRHPSSLDTSLAA